MERTSKKVNKSVSKYIIILELWSELFMDRKILGRMNKDENK